MGSCVRRYAKTCSEAERVPAAEGLKEMLIAQELPTATVLPQLSVSEKLAAPAPVRETMTPPRAPLPEFVKVSVCTVDVVPTACEGNVNAPGVSDGMGPVTPIPVTGRTASGMDAFELIVRLAVSVSVAVGE